MNDLQTLIKTKQKLGSISQAAVLGLPIFLSFSRVFREWAPWMVKPYRALTPIYVFGLLIIFFKYRKTLHEIIFFKLNQDLTGNLLEKDEQSTVNELKARQKRIQAMPWFKRNYWLIASLAAAVGVDSFLWTLAKQMGRPIVLSVIFAVLAAGMALVYYWRHEFFSKQEKIILNLIK